jgi:hypothetical protein
MRRASAIELVRDASAEWPALTRQQLVAATGLSYSSLTRALRALGAHSPGRGGHAGGKVRRLNKQPVVSA